ncbi:hypothetical protein F2Q69_00053964 [Brassica cretica]|uniref:Putative plant transposon protein domain-containing protein n=1 Tax=Brassica cretica TaxID=69181 RepID=A0A8S9MV97_BRACR|nr:hypothetical protein F2Q69_00053964 [Brassica cretica]
MSVRIPLFSCSVLVTTLNPKRFGGVLSLSSMASSRVFLDSDVQETRFYLSWLNSNLDVANKVNVEVVTKPETATLGELFSYMNQASAKVAWFECTSTIDDVVHGSGWYYIGCGVCHTKATKGSTTLMCKKCGKSEIVGVAQYLSKLSAYDHNDQAVFVVLGEELTGKKAAELVERYYQTRRFIVMVSNYNMTGKTQTLTVTKVLPLKAPEPEGNLGENVDEEPDNEKDDHADESVKRGADGIESEAIRGYSRRHHNEEAAIGYRYLCLRGFVVQGSLDPKDPVLDDVFRIIDSIGWSYTVMHLHSFCPRVVREFISNKPYNDEGALIRGYVLPFTPSVINQLMMTPSVEHSLEWKEVVLKQAISHLTGGQCSRWTGFNLNALLNPFQTIYRVCELNWLPGPDSDSMMKNRLRLLYAVANRKEISFGHLVYDQVIDMTRKTEWDTSLIFPNLIYQLLMLQKEVPLLPGDEEPIGRGLPIYGVSGDTSGPRGRRRLN